jgi:3D (Asp-Asp-Asp) domain-containing protein
MAAALIGCTALSAMFTKQLLTSREMPALARVDGTGNRVPDAAEITVSTEVVAEPDVAVIGEASVITDPLAAPPEREASVPSENAWASDPEIRWFNGRPVRPKRVMWMVTTAYSPDERSCGDSADGITASLHSVWTNGMKLAAADTRLLPMGSMISVPGYDQGRIIPVLDRGGAIKGHRLDLLYPTHEIARKWGKQRLPVTVWEYADGEPSHDYRKVRDSKN